MGGVGGWSAEGGEGGVGRGMGAVVVNGFEEEEVVVGVVVARAGAGVAVAGVRGLCHHITQKNEYEHNDNDEGMQRDNARLRAHDSTIRPVRLEGLQHPEPDALVDPLRAEDHLVLLAGVLAIEALA